MNRPWLHILMPKFNMDVSFITFAEAPEVFEAFNVTKGVNVPNGVDLVYCQHYNASFRELRNSMAPYVLFIGGDVWYEVSELGYSEKKEKFTKLFQDASGVCCISPQIARTVLSYTNQSKNLFVLPGGLWGTEYAPRGVDFESFERKTDYRIQYPPFKIVMSINFSVKRKWEGVPIFLQTIDCISKKLRFSIECYGRAKSPEVQRLIRAWEKRYPWFSFRHMSSNWKETLRNADLFVHPSLFDGWPRSVAEAMCSALPIMAFTIPGSTWVNPHIVNVYHDDKEMMKEEFESLVTDQGRRQMLGGVLYKEAETSSKIYRGAFLHVFKSILWRPTL